MVPSAILRRRITLATIASSTQSRTESTSPLRHRFRLTIQSVNDVPSVTPLSDLVIPEGSVLARSGSFSDADVGDSWTATVDYGDGSGVQPLTLVGTTFALNHAYADSGEYLTTVSVVDRDGAMGSATFQRHAAKPCGVRRRRR